MIAGYPLSGEDLSEVKIEDLVLVKGRGLGPLYFLAAPDDREVSYHLSSQLSGTQDPSWHFKAIGRRLLFSSLVVCK
jgi:hypothetical protein